jgi:hypothetical protein
VIRDNLKGTSDNLLPEVIHNRIQVILKSSDNLNDSDLRKIRILYNMLKTSVVNEKKDGEKKEKEKNSKKEKKKKVKKDGEVKADVMEKPEDKPERKEEKLEKKEKPVKEQLVKKQKGKKRYVVFLGNLPLEVNKEMVNVF